MLCENCGQPLEEGMKFCTACGAPVKINANGMNLQKAGPEQNPYGYSASQPAHSPDVKQFPGNGQEASNLQQGYGSYSEGGQSYGQAAFGQQAYGQPGSGQPAYNSQDVRGQNPQDQSSYGSASYGPASYGPASYGQNDFNQNAYSQNASAQNAYGQNPYGGAPYGQSPYGGAPYGQGSYGGAPYEQSPYGSAPYGQNAYQSQAYQPVGPAKDMSFSDAITSFLSHYFDCRGRARRKEYWYVVLFNVIATLIFNVLSGIFSNGFLHNLIHLLSVAYSLALFIPGIMLSIRRMHDIGKGGAWLFICLIPIVGPLIFIYLCCKDSVPGTNQYGPNPKYS